MVGKDGRLTAVQVRSCGRLEKNGRTRRFDLRKNRGARGSVSSYGQSQRFAVWILVWSPTLAIYVVPRAELSPEQRVVCLPPRCKYLNNWEVFGHVDVD